MRKITKNYLAWNYLAVIALTISMVGTIIVCFNEGSHVKGDCVFVLIWSVVWICIVPMFVGNLAKENHLKPKFWFGFSFFTAILPIIIAIICLVYLYNENYLPLRAFVPDSVAGMDNVHVPEEWYPYKFIFNKTVYISALLPVVSFMVFWLYCIFSGQNWSNEDITIDEEQIDLSQIHSICPHCKNPNTKKLRECEWCGSKIC